MNAIVIFIIYWVLWIILWRILSRWIHESLDWLVKQIRKRKHEVFYRQPIVERYLDFVLVGEYEQRNMQTGDVKTGLLYRETVKFKGHDGKLKIGHRWVPDNSREYQGFES